MQLFPAPARRVRGFLFLALALWTSSAGAHELWLMAGKYRLAPGELTRVFINSGDQFPESLSLVSELRLETVALHGPLETRPIHTFRVDGKSLSFDLQATAIGSHVVALGTRPRRVRLKAKDFQDYLEENGLERILALRDELGENEDATVERYSKWAKATIDVDVTMGDSGSGESDLDKEPSWSKPVGHTIEIVPSRNPNRVRPGEELEVQLFYQGEPLADIPIFGGKAGGPRGEIRTSTDGSGKAVVTIPSDGRWYLSAIHLVRVDDDPQILWESFWCTLTFEIAEQGERSP
ncbi:MAG: DUF4198 domain-containing protein [Acidobacteria bacterium]|nr:MAG: DUF4198 domain-containing protein [Acidobacteriota bacterium]